MRNSELLITRAIEMNEDYINYIIIGLKKYGLAVDMMRGYQIGRKGLNDYLISPLSRGDFLNFQADEAGVRTFLKNQG